MKQNIFDDERFFPAYMEYRDSPKCLNAAIEQPALRQLLPDLKRSRVLDIGSGTGDFCEYALKQGADFVLGVDVSRRMCARAEMALSKEPRARFVNQAIEDFQWQGDHFDVIVSSLALHYVEPLADIVRRTSSWLREGGVYLISVNHPLYTATLGHEQAAGGSPACLNTRNYWAEGSRPHTWFVDGVVKYHRTMETYFRLLNSSGLRLMDFRELSPQSLGVSEWVGDPRLTERPIFVLFRAEKEPR
jgi:SAM-dependent methyltransferase